MYDIYTYLELVREYCTMGKPFCVNGVGLLMYRTSSAGNWVMNHLYNMEASIRFEFVDMNVRILPKSTLL